jgi:hypothetical protein
VKDRVDGDLLDKGATCGDTGLQGDKALEDKIGLGNKEDLVRESMLGKGDDLICGDLFCKGEPCGDRVVEDLLLKKTCGDRVVEDLLGKGDKIGDNGEEYCVKDTGLLEEATLGDKIGLDNGDL